MINLESIKKLGQLAKQDENVMTLLNAALRSFEDYHAAIYASETHLMLHGLDEQATELERSRTSAHNAMIADVSIINRIAVGNDIPRVYEGIVSGEYPHRSEIAEAVLTYVEETVKHRTK